MSEPFKNYEDHAHGVISELVSACSALNMEPDPIPAEEIERIREDRGYAWLSDTDRWVSHSMEHIHQAIREAEKAGDKIRQLESRLHRISVAAIERSNEKISDNEFLVRVAMILGEYYV